MVFLWKLKFFGGFVKNPKIKFKKCVWMCVNKEVFVEGFAVISCFWKSVCGHMCCTSGVMCFVFCDRVFLRG